MVQNMKRAVKRQSSTERTKYRWRVRNNRMIPADRVRLRAKGDK